MAELMNSEKYWDKRFQTDWQEFSGEEQTKFFAQLMCQMFPQWFVRKVRENKYTVCDMGCALGDAVDVLTKYLNVDIAGADFSETAIKVAKQKYPVYNFEKIDLKNIPDGFRYDILVASNVLEHFEKPWSIVENMANAAQKYIVLMMPYQEKLKIAEHVYQFDCNVIPMIINEFSLVHCRVVDGNELKDTAYPDQQILLIYSNDSNDKKIAYLSDVCNVNSIIEKELKASLQQECEKNLFLQSDNERLSQTVEMLNFELSKQLENSRLLEEKNNELKVILAEVEEKNDELKLVLAEMDEKSRKLKQQLDEEAATKEQIECELQHKNNVIDSAERLCMQLATTKPFKLAHFLRRLKYQGIKGSKDERKNFRKWLLSKISGHGGDFDRRYNQIYWIINLLLSAKQNGKMDVVELGKAENNIVINELPMYFSTQTNTILENKYEKFDVIIFAIIGYDFRFQRPQHFATRFVENGHRVFYINADYHIPTSIEERQPGLFIVNIHNDKYNAIHATDWRNQMDELQKQLKQLMDEYCIRDAISIVDYPNWVYAAKYLRENYGFKIITDYMDDFTGFLNPAEDLVRKNCEYLLKISDQIIASSQFLYDIAAKYHEGIGLVRNGTEFEHFYSARGNVRHERKVIGYYGAVAEWFDCDKVTYLAKNLPECDIVIIGHVTSGGSKLDAYSNIKLLGEKPYSELPGYLKEFDVCLIPFDTSTDLIKATNPVKFYEYLSAGKKVVATEIPELEPFRNKYVYMSNNDDEFLEYVRLCLKGEDILADTETCIQFAQENDWQHRYEAFAEICTAMVPKVSIIVLTYNNLKLNKLCIESILTKTAYPNYELIIVDNCSNDGTREYLQDICGTNPKIKVILNTDNKGFAAGNNVGIQAANGDYILLLNNDTIVTRGWLTAMSKHLENDAELGMCGPVTNSIGNESKIKVNYHDVDSMHQFAYWYTTNHLNEEYNDIRVLALFCTMIKKEVIEACGMLDEAYKVGMFEDDDYAESVKSNGYRIAVVEDAFIHHFAGASFKKLEDEKYRKIFEENKKIFENKWNTKWIMHKNRPGLEWDANLDIDILNALEIT